MCALFKIYLQPWKKVILRSFLKLVIFSNFLKIMATTQAKTNENFVCVIASFLRPWSHLCYRFRNAPSFFSYCLSMSQTEKDFLFFSKLMALYMCFAYGLAHVFCLWPCTRTCVLLPTAVNSLCNTQSSMNITIGNFITL